MKAQVKLKNMEMWIIDYNDQPDEKANILQLKFITELEYNLNSFSKQITCTSLPPS